MLDRTDMDLATYIPELDDTLGAALLAPTRIYAKDCLALASEIDVHAFTHITGGGLAANLARSLPESVDATLDRSSWSLSPVFSFIAEHGGVSSADMESTFNMGVGMAAIVAAPDTDHALSVLNARGVPAWLMGSVTQGGGNVHLAGMYA